MYDYDRRTTAARLWDRESHDYQRVMSSLTKDVVKKTVMLVSNVLDLAKQAVHSLKFNDSFKGHDDLEKLEKPLESLAKWMLSRRELEAEPVAMFAKLTADLAEKTSFWNTPKFLNKDKHAREVEVIVERMQKVKRQILEAFRMSGAWTAAPST